MKKKLTISIVAAVAMLVGCGEDPGHKKSSDWPECNGNQDCAYGLQCWYGECRQEPSVGHTNHQDYGDNHPAAGNGQYSANCTSDQDCAAGDICRSESCQQETDERSVWCWDDDLSDRDGVEGGTCHDHSGYWSPEVWRRADYPDGPPACGGPRDSRTRYPTQVECCRAGSDFDTRTSQNYRECLAQPDGEAWTWNE